MYNNMVPFSAKYAVNRIPYQEIFGAVRAAATDIQETDGAYVLETNLPGFEKEEISVNLKEDVLTIHAEHKEERNDEEKSGGGYIRRERIWGTVDRCFTVSDVDAEGIQAAYNNGVLTVTLPKKPEVIPEQHDIVIQ